MRCVPLPNLPPFGALLALPSYGNFRLRDGALRALDRSRSRPLNQGSFKTPPREDSVRAFALLSPASKQVSTSRASGRQAEPPVDKTVTVCESAGPLGFLHAHVKLGVPRVKRRSSCVAPRANETEVGSRPPCVLGLPKQVCQNNGVDGSEPGWLSHQSQQKGSFLGWPQ